MMRSSILDVKPPEPGRRIAYGTDGNQFGELRMPEGDGPHPVVMFLHGGYWRARYDLTHAGHLCVALAKAGCAVWNVEYRRVGQPGGGYPGTLDDVRSAAEHVHKLPGVDANRVVVAGHSAGGQLALWLAAQNVVPLRAVVGLAAVSDLRRGHQLGLGDGAIEEFIGCAPTECSERYAGASPIELLPLKVPQILVHGTADDVVPFELSERFVKASTNARLVTLSGADHYSIIDPRAKEWPTVLGRLSLRSDS